MTVPGVPSLSSACPPSRAGRRCRHPLILLPAAALIVALALVGAAAGLGSRQAVRLVPVGALKGDPLAFDSSKTAAFESAAAAGESQVLYAKSPGGVLVAAARTARFRPLVNKATAGTGIDPNIVEAIVMLESGGRPDVIAGPDAADAAGLTQILAETGTDFLGMQIDLAKSRRLTKRIAVARRHHDRPAMRELLARRRAIDARFDPAKAIAATVSYLATADARFGREDLAVVSYHMGMGNLDHVLRDYAQAPPAPPISRVVEQNGLSWAQIYFNSSPVDHATAWQLLTSFGDDSQTYYWRVLAAEKIMRLYRDQPRELRRLAYLHKRKASAEEVLHPLRATLRFETPSDIDTALSDGVLQALPNHPRQLHFRVDKRLGELAPQLAAHPHLYRALQPEALAMLLYIAARVHEISGSATPLTVTSAVRDEAYQRLLLQTNVQATPKYSLHTSGFAFDLLRRYGSGAEAQALQYELDRLQALDLIAWVREPLDIHVTVSSAASVLIPATLKSAA